MGTATPTPRTLYIHDDLSELAEADPRAGKLIAALLALLGRDPTRVVVLSPARQLDALAAQGPHAPFAAAVGLGAAGLTAAARLHARTGWFPVLERVDVWREEDDQGGYVLTGPAPLAVQLAAVAGAPSLALVDDTIFSGLTMRGVLAALPPGARARSHVFCLRAVASSLAEVRRLAPASAGFVADGRLLDDVSFINASGLVRRGAIRRRDRPPLAFFERPEWMAAWFPGYHDEVIAVCRALQAELSGALA